MPLIDDIPVAARLQGRYDSLKQALASLQNGGAINLLTVDCSPVGKPMVGVALDPPIDDLVILAAVIANLRAQIAILDKQLADMGYDASPPA